MGAIAGYLVGDIPVQAEPDNKAGNAGAITFYLMEVLCRNQIFGQHRLKRCQRTGIADNGFGRKRRAVGHVDAGDRIVFDTDFRDFLIVKYFNWGRLKVKKNATELATTYLFKLAYFGL